VHTHILPLQSRLDKTLRAKLGDEQCVKQALARVDREINGFGFGLRRRLLAGALRLTRSMSPEVADALSDCRSATGFEQPVEIYVRPDADFAAFCAKSAAGPVTIALSSRIIEAFDGAKLRFVIGHELGHVIYDHFSLPMPLTALIEDMGGRIVDRATALRLYYWCRAAEISADRIGLVCCRNPEAAMESFLALASGITPGRLKPDMPTFARQIDSLASAPEARVKPHDNDLSLDSFDTHPFNPTRVRALLAFARSSTYAAATKTLPHPRNLTHEELEHAVERDLSIMEPSYLEEQTDAAKLMRRVLYQAGIKVALAHGEIAPSELAALKALLGSEAVKNAPNVEEVRTKLPVDLAAAAKDVPLFQRAQLVQHLTIIAGADGNVHDNELMAMREVASALGVNPMVIEQTLAAAAMPMD